MAKKNQGFTLLEITMVVGLVALLAGLSMYVGIDSYRHALFFAERDLAVTILHTARSRALNNINGKDHGVHFNPSEYILFEGPSFEGRDSSRDQIIPANTSRTISGLQDIVFSKLSGESNAVGTITISNGTHTATVLLNNEARIDW